MTNKTNLNTLASTQDKEQDMGATPTGSGCEATPSAASSTASSRSRIPSAFTPGPWIVRECQGDAYIVPADHLKRPLGFSIFEKDNRERNALQITCLRRSELKGFETPEERRANAALIASAPRLYGELERIRDHLNWLCPYVHNERLRSEIESDAWGAGFALAEARGEIASAIPSRRADDAEGGSAGTEGSAVPKGDAQND